MKPGLLILPVLITICGLISCQRSTGESKKLAQVGNEILYEADFKANFSSDEWQNLSAENRKKYIEQWVNITLMAQEAEKMGFNKEEAIKQRIEYASKKILANALIASRMAELRISEDDMFNYYRLHLGEFQKPIQEYKIQRIFVYDRNKIDRIKMEIRSGLAFGTAVGIYSEERLRDTGGFMGFVTNTGIDSVFWDVARNLKQGELGLVERDEGYYIIRQYEERSAVGEAGFEMFKDEIRKRILQERRQEVYEDLLLELKKINSKIYYY